MKAGADRRVILVLMIVALSGLVGCGSDNSSSQCSPANCGGCCQGGKCQSGNTSQACGQGGTACQACPSGNSCSTGVCGTGGPSCSYLTCQQGCCSTSGQCQSITDDSQCGSLGAPCQPCPTTHKCVAGQCVPKTTTGCDSSCPGCCVLNACMPGDSKSACGKNKAGGTCVACSGAEVCIDGQCKIPPQPCDSTTCKDGCCTGEGKCILFVQQTLKGCGKNGAACSICPTDAVSCTQGTCVSKQACSTFCSKGCCDAAQQCVLYASQDVLKCGTAGASCAPCSGNPSCVDGQCVGGGSWQIWAMSAQISPKNPSGSDWDWSWTGADPKPDPFIGIGPYYAQWIWQWYFSATQDNTYTPYWNQKLAVWKEADLLDPNGVKFILFDDDLGAGYSNELIGDCTVTLQLSQLLAGNYVIPVCGSASNVTIKFVKQ